MLAWLHEHESLLWWLGALSVVTWVGTIVLLPLVVARLPADYFTPTHRSLQRHHGQKRWPRLLGRLGKNLLGLLVVLAGIAMLVLPGQGILTIAIGFLLLDIPGKERLERRLVQQPAVWRALNWMRAKAHQPPLEKPPTATPVPGERGVARDA